MLAYVCPHVRRSTTAVSKRRYARHDPDIHCRAARCRLGGKDARTVGGSGLRAGMRTLRHDAGGGIRLRYAWSGLTQFRPACSRSSGDESGSLPGWHGLAGRESICGGPRKGQNAKLPIKKEPTLPPTCKHVCDRIGSQVSGRDDLNVRPLEPHSSALPGCATPRARSEYITPPPLGQMPRFLATSTYR